MITARTTPTKAKMTDDYDDDGDCGGRGDDGGGGDDGSGG